MNGIELLTWYHRAQVPQDHATSENEDEKHRRGEITSDDQTIVRLYFLFFKRSITRAQKEASG